MFKEGKIMSEQISKQSLFSQVKHLDDSTPLFVNSKSNNVETRSQISGISSLFAISYLNEQRETFDQIKSLIRSHPKLQTIANEADKFLDKLKVQNKAITAGDVKQIIAMYDMKKGLEVGEKFANENKIPQFFKTSFASFVAKNGISLENKDEQRVALNQFLVEEFINNKDNFQILTRNKDFPVPIQNVITGYAKESGFFEKYIEQRFLTNFDNFKFSSLQEFAKNLEPMSELLSLFSEGELTAIAEQHKTAADKNATLLNLFNEIKDLYPIKDCHDILKACLKDNDSLNSLQERTFAVRKHTCQMLTGVPDYVCMNKFNIPEQYREIICHNPEIVDAAVKQLTLENENVYPKVESLFRALDKVTEQFLEKKSALINEAVLMLEGGANISLAGLDDKYKPYLFNALLSGQDIIEPLINDSVAVDGAFLNKVSAFYNDVLSGVKLLPEEERESAFDKIMTAALTVLLQQRGISALESKFSATLMANAVSKFASITSAANQKAVQINKDQNAAPADMNQAEELLHINCVVKQLVKSIYALDNEDILTVPDWDVPQSTLAQESFNKLFNTVFLSKTETDLLPDALRDYLNADAALAIKELPSDSINYQAVEKAQAWFSNKDAIPPEIREKVFDDVIIKAKAQGVASSLFDSANYDYTLVLADIKNEVLNRAIQVEGNGTTLTDEDISNIAREVVLKDIKELSNLIDFVSASDSILLRNNLNVHLSPEEKTGIIGNLHRLGIRDLNALKEVIGTYKNIVESTLPNLVAPDPIDSQIISAIYTIKDKFGTLAFNFKKADQQTQANLRTFVLNMTTVLSAQTFYEGQSIKDRLTACLSSVSADRVDSSLQYLSKIAQEQNRLGALTQLHESSQVLHELKQIANVTKVNDPFTSLTQLKGGDNGIVSHLARGDAINLLPAEFQKLSKINPPLSESEYWIMNAIIKQYTNNDPKNSDAINALVSSAPQIIDFYNKSGYVPEGKDLYRIVSGGAEMPDNVSDDEVVIKAYESLYNLVLEKIHDSPGYDDDVTPSQIAYMINCGAFFGCSPELIRQIALGQKTDISGEDLNCPVGELPSLTDFNPKNNYFLDVDFHRWKGRTSFTFIQKDGEEVVFRPSRDLSADPDKKNMLYKSIILSVYKMMGKNEITDELSEENRIQLSRVFCLLSQAGIADTRCEIFLPPYSNADEHGSYLFNIKAQEDGSIELVIKTDPDSIYDYSQSFVVRSDGSYACTDFKIAIRENAAASSESVLSVSEDDEFSV